MKHCIVGGLAAVLIAGGLIAAAPPALSTNLVVNAAPMPDAPPVTNATFPDTLDAIGEG